MNRPKRPKEPDYDKDIRELAIAGARRRLEADKADLLKDMKDPAPEINRRSSIGARTITTLQGPGFVSRGARRVPLKLGMALEHDVLVH